ncbi:MAG TPA: hypothetical protein VEW66_02030 [Thermomicrobiales bacterium]|nr:hypothetical protein [Thermomicrobiales bacterium]
MFTKNRADTRRIHTRTLLGLTAAACLVGLTAAPAAAEKPFENVHERVTETFEEEVCGIDVETTVSFVDHFLARIGPDGFPLFQASGRGTTTWYNPETDLSVTVENRGGFKDLSVTDNGDGTITVVTQVVGIPVEITLDDGTVALKDVGRIVFSTVLDYNDTPTDAEDDEFISQEILSISGPHPDAESDFMLFCETVVEGLT